MLALPPGCHSVDFLSDVHLRPEAPRTFEAWRAHMLGTPSQAIYILGDLFELWIGDDAAGGTFEGRCIEVLCESARTRHLAFLPGNRDFLLGQAVCRRVPMQALPDPVVMQGYGTRLLLAHGDAWCLEDAPYQAFRQEVRSPAWQQDFLARPLAERAEMATGIRRASQARKRELPDPSLWADLDAGAVRSALREAGACTLVHGHTHRPACHALGEGLERWVLSDWDLEGTAARADVLRWSATGLARHGVPAP
ncbi:MAG: UDP-2,3-diacylglucosamine diphosphatase [Rubrivivax sp.]